VDFNAGALDHLRTPLAVMLAHIQLLTLKRLSDTGRQRLHALDGQVRLLMRLLDTYRTPPAQVRPVAQVDMSLMLGEVVSELDAVLNDEASRPC
jgi:signal transduction histidine kinase